MQHLVVDVVQAFQAQTTLAGLLRPETLQELWITVGEAADQVQHQVRSARREPTRAAVPSRPLSYR